MRMIEVYYSLDEAVEILGTQKDVELFRQEILGFLKTDSKEIRIKIKKNINSEPWDFVAKSLNIVENDKPVKVSVSDGNIIKIEGSKENLEAFTSFLIFDEDAVSGSHSHYEYYEGNEYINSESFPLIIGIK